MNGKPPPQDAGDEGGDLPPDLPPPGEATTQPTEPPAQQPAGLPAAPAAAAKPSADKVWRYLVGFWTYLKDKFPEVAGPVALFGVVLTFVLITDAQGVDDMKLLRLGAVVLALIVASALVMRWLRNRARRRWKAVVRGEGPGRAPMRPWLKGTLAALAVAAAAPVVAYGTMVFVALGFPGNGITLDANCLLTFKFGDACRVLMNGAALDRAIDDTTPSVVEPPKPADIPKAQAIDKQAFRVFIKFAGFVRRDMGKLNAALDGAGWRAEGDDGERTDKAAGRNEVRYHSAAQKEAAVALAAAVGAVLKREIAVTELSVVAPAVLEVWISL